MNDDLVTAQGEDILAFLDRAIAAREQAANAAHATDPAPWAAHTNAEPTRDHDRTAGSGLLVAADGNPLWDCEGSGTLCMTAAASTHAALNDPGLALRRCAADRKLLAMYRALLVDAPRSHYADAGDLALQQERTLPALNILRPVLLALAEGYGWTEGER
jgi:hypothetical protein